MKYSKSILITLCVLVSLSFMAVGNIMAHCDTVDGPVVKDARIALDRGDITPVLKWVRPDSEDEIRAAFQKTLAMRAKGEDVKTFADTYFFETLVRVHRAGEGAPYTGLKPMGTVDPAVAMADEALDGGNVDQLVTVLTNAMASGIRDRFHRVSEARKNAETSVAAGREFVESYVTLTHYVEGLHGLIKGGSGQHGKGAH